MRYVFVTGMGRSGTAFLAQMLGSVSDVRAKHEQIGHREYCVLSWCMQRDEYAVPFLEREKECIERSAPVPWFVDVNSYLRYSVDALRIVFRPAAVFHLVRDPRDVVRSIYLRRDERHVQVVPKDGATLRRWLREDKFYRVCWNWADATGRLMEQGARLLQFERVTNDYGYLRDQLLEPLAWNLSEAAWHASRKTKVNRTRGAFYRLAYARLKGKAFERRPLGPYSMWSDSQKEVFREVCGPIMEPLGYELG